MHLMLTLLVVLLLELKMQKEGWTMVKKREELIGLIKDVIRELRKSLRKILEEGKEFSPRIHLYFYCPKCEKFRVAEIIATMPIDILRAFFRELFWLWVDESGICRKCGSRMLLLGYSFTAIIYYVDVRDPKMRKMAERWFRMHGTFQGFKYTKEGLWTGLYLAIGPPCQWIAPIERNLIVKVGEDVEEELARAGGRFAIPLPPIPEDIIDP